VVENPDIGSGLPVLPVVEWDDEPIGDGEVGKLMMVLSDLLWEDMKSDRWSLLLFPFLPSPRLPSRVMAIDALPWL
jgi:hypothetical protein